MALEKNDIFSVRSAYRSALNELHWPSIGAASRAPDGLRAIWASLWRCIAPARVCTFVWRLVTDPLPTGVIKHSRNKEVTNVCPICGTEPECSFHALCRCPHAQSLWRAMSEVWRLRRLDLMQNIGPEWIFIYSCVLPRWTAL